MRSFVMSDPRDYKVEVSGLAQPAAGGARQSRPFLSVQFACCSVYQRVYRDADGRRYAGRCPRCGRAVTFAVGAGGTNSRFFVVS